MLFCCFDKNLNLVHMALLPNDEHFSPLLGWYWFSGLESLKPDEGEEISDQLLDFIKLHRSTLIPTKLCHI